MSRDKTSGCGGGEESDGSISIGHKTKSGGRGLREPSLQCRQETRPINGRKCFAGAKKIASGSGLGGEKKSEKVKNGYP